MYFPLIFFTLLVCYPSNSFPQSECPCDYLRPQNDRYRHCLDQISLDPLFRPFCEESPEGQYTNCGEEPKNFDKQCCEEFSSRILAEREELEKEGYSEVRPINLTWVGTYCLVRERQSSRRQISCSNINSSSDCCNARGCNWITQRGQCGQATITERKGLLRGTYIKTHNKPC